MSEEEAIQLADRLLPKPEKPERLIQCLKDLYRHAEPPVDIDKLDHQIQASDHKIKKDLFEKILRIHDVSISDNTFFFLNKAPSIVD